MRPACGPIVYALARRTLNSMVPCGSTCTKGGMLGGSMEKSDIGKVRDPTTSIWSPTTLACTGIVTDLMDTRWLVEIEAEAVLP